MKNTAIVIAQVFLGAVLATTLALIIPFIGFGGSYETVIADAASAYNLDINDYEVVFKDSEVNAYGESVQGLYRVKGAKETITIVTSWSRPMVVATIFHEFAHAAQRKYNIDREGLNIEQHAEYLSFTTMWNSAYRYDAIHLLYLHAFGGKSDYYNALPQLLNTAAPAITLVLTHLTQGLCVIILAATLVFAAHSYRARPHALRTYRIAY